MPGTVTVGCKVPTGLKLQMYRMEDYSEPVMSGGTRTVKRAVPTGTPVILNGNARFIGKDTPREIRNGAGLTYGVDADFFAAWLVAHKDSDVVRNGLVFAQAKPGETVAQAKDHIPLKSGLEPIDPKNVGPEFKGKNGKSLITAQN